MPEVLQKIIAASGLCSRRKAQEYIVTGKVMLNRRVAKLGDRAEVEVDEIRVSGKQLPQIKRLYFAFYKPRGIVTTLSAQKGQKTIRDFIPKNIRLIPVGRLDKESEGLLLLTTDGNFANRVSHPRYGQEKTYEVRLHRHLGTHEQQKLERGMRVDGRKTAPIRVRKITGSTYELTLHEGRNRIIRKITGALGYEVLALKRVSIGPVSIGTLKGGEMRPLLLKEIDFFLTKTTL